MNTDNSGAVAQVVQRLGLELPDRSPVQIISAVLDVWDHAVRGVPAVETALASARARLG
jgi:hypothetical protein